VRLKKRLVPRIYHLPRKITCRQFAACFEMVPVSRCVHLQSVWEVIGNMQCVW